MHDKLKINYKVRNLLVFVSFLFIGLAIYSNSLHGEFCSDDISIIVENSAIRDITRIQDIWASFGTRLIGGLSFAVNYHIGELNVFGYHVFNIISHCLASYLVYAFVILTFQTPQMRRHPAAQHRYSVAYIAALIFLCHPIQTQGVAYTAQRLVSLATIFYLGALVFYIKARIDKEPKYYIGVFVSMLLGVFTKENVFTLPLTVCVYEAVFLGPFEKKQRKQCVAVILAMALLTLVPLVLAKIRINADLNFMDPVGTATFHWNYFLTEINVLRTYLRLFFIPIGQSHSYDYPISTGLNLSTVFSACLLSILFAFAVYQIRKQRLLSFAIIWFFITTSVEIAFVCLYAPSGLAGVMYDHWLYLPMVGFSLFLAVFLYSLPMHMQFRKAIFVGLIAISCALTMQRNQIWQQCSSVWEDVIKSAPNDQLPYTKLGVLYGREGRVDKALPYFKKAIQLDPSNPQSHNNICLAYTALERYSSALLHCQEAVQLDPYYSDGYNNLGMVYVHKKDWQRAKGLFQKALLYNANHSLAYQNLVFLDELEQNGLLNK